MEKILKKASEETLREVRGGHPGSEATPVGVSNRFSIKVLKVNHSGGPLWVLILRGIVEVLG